VRPFGKLRIEEATKWIGGLDRIHRTRDILACYDFSATPFAPSDKKSTEEALFTEMAARVKYAFASRGSVTGGVLEADGVEPESFGAGHWSSPAPDQRDCVRETQRYG
jgi:hypothetical protein